MKFLPYVSLVVSILGLLIVLNTISCDVRSEPEPEASQFPVYPEFEWSLSELDWSDRQTAINECLSTLKLIDRSIYEIEKSRWKWGATKDKMEYATLLQRRIELLSLIYSISQDMRWGVDVDVE